MVTELNDFISSVRNADSLQQEKFLISTEMAKLRADLKAPDPEKIPIILLKLIFLNIYGENISWGQMPAVTLMASKSFSYKRIGYLATSQLISETNDLSVLITQTLLSDLMSKNPHVVTLALAFISNCASADICKETATTVQKVVSQASNESVLKKGATALIRIMRKVPELVESCKNSFQKLLNSNNHGVVIAGTIAVITALEIEPRMRKIWKCFIPPFIMILKSLAFTHPPSEYAYGVTYDPFLQCYVMRALTLLRARDEKFGSLLQSIIASTDARKNAQRAVLYQAVETVVALMANASLRGLAFNQVGRLLVCKDTNILFSALSVFNRVLYKGENQFSRGTADSIALQRYRKQIVKCLDNQDASIRRVALSVILALIDESNVTKFVPEIIQYLKLADSDFRAELVNRLYYATVRLGNDPSWIFDTIINVIEESDGYFGTELVTAFTTYIINHAELKDHAVAKLRNSLDSSDNQTLILIAAFILGELSDQIDTEKEKMKIILSLPQTKNDVKVMIMMSLAKLAARLGSREEVISILDNLTKSNDIEVQQRAGELVRILQLGDACETILAPVGPDEQTEKKQNAKAEVPKAVKQEPAQQAKEKQSTPDDLLSMLLNTPVQPIAQAQKEPQVSDQSKAPDALLLDLTSQPQPQPQQQSQAAPANPAITAPVSIPKPPNSFEIMQNQDFVMYGQVQRNPNNPSQIALMTTVFSKIQKQLPDFHIEMRISNGWKLMTKNQSSSVLLPSPASITILSYIYASDSPFALNYVISYRFGSQPIRETYILRSLP